MRITNFTLKNFRGFDKLDIRFPEKGPAIFVGINGAGKTSILEAIKNNLGFLFQELQNFIHFQSIPIEDLKFLQHDNKIKEKPLVLNAKYKISNSIFSFHSKSLKNDNFLKLSFDKNSSNISFNNLVPFFKKSPPVIMYYHTQRIIDTLNVDVEHDTNKLSIYKNALNGKVDFNNFSKWFRKTEDYENAQRLHKDPSYRHKGLEAVRKVIESFLPDFKNPMVKRDYPEEIIIEKNGTILSINNLSHGEKIIFAMAGDIARRLSIANPDSGDPLKGYGIVMIDEIELHLHPEWQRKIVPLLEKIFPNIQFILTTHSPQVLSNVKRKNVFLLENFKLVKTTPHTYGKDSNSILSDIFGLKKRPAEAQKEFIKLYRLIEEPSKVNESKVLLKKLTEKYGEFDEDILRANLHFDFLNE